MARASFILRITWLSYSKRMIVDPAQNPRKFEILKKQDSTRFNFVHFRGTRGRNQVGLQNSLFFSLTDRIRRLNRLLLNQQNLLPHLGSHREYPYLLGQGHLCTDKLNTHRTDV